MDLTGFISYVLSFFSFVAGLFIFFGDDEHFIPALGRSLQIPCTFLFLFLALIFWAMAVKIEDDDTII